MNKSTNSYGSIRRILAIAKVILRLVLLVLEVIERWHSFSK